MNVNITKKKISGVPRNFVSMPNANILMAFEIYGMITAEQLEKALVLLVSKHLLLKAKISIDTSNNAWFSFDREYKPIINTYKDQKLKDIVLSEFKQPLNLNFGSLVRYNLIYQKESTILLITCNHMICDGLSMFYLIEDILKYLNNNLAPETISSELIFMDTENIPIKLDNFLIKLFVNKINKKWKNSDVLLTNKDYQQMFQRFWDKQFPQVMHNKLSKELTGRLIKQCKDNHLTVNSFLATVFIYCQQTLLPKLIYSNDYTISVNLREYLKKHPGQKVGYFVSAIRLKFKYDFNKPFWENTKRFQAKFKSKFKLKSLFRSQIMGLFNPKFVDALFMNKHNQRNDKSIRSFLKKKKLDRVNSAFTITNLGVVNIQTTGTNFELTGIIPPFIQSDTMEKYISIATFKGELSIAISYNHEIIQQNYIEKFANRSKDLIEEFVNYKVE